MYICPVISTKNIYVTGPFQSAGRDDEKSCSNMYQIAPDKFSIIVDMSSLTNMSGRDNLWYQVTCMAYLSEEVAATYVMQHFVTRAVPAKTDINEVYRKVSRSEHCFGSADKDMRVHV